MDNLTYIRNTDPKAVKATLSRMGVGALHATNGVFAGPANILLPTNLAYFKMMDDQYDDGAFLIGVNSDASVKILDQQKEARGEKIPQSIPQDQRVGMIGNAVAQLFPQRSVILAVYDSDKPIDMYEELARSDMEMRTLFKGNYGTVEGAGKIEGSHCFERVIASPLPHVTAHILPYAALVTDPADAEEIERYEITKLTEDAVQLNGRPYLAESNQLLFSTPQALQFLCDPSMRPQARQPKF